MSDGLSTAPGFATPVRGVETKWLDEFRRDSIAIHLRSGARVPVPYLFWGTQALQIDGLADADAVDDVLQELGGGQGNLRAQHVNERFEPDGGSGQAHVQIWAPHYEGTSMGPIKAVYGLVQVEPRRSCRRAQDRDLPHLWWWWYYGNSPVNHEFKRDVWGIPNELAPVETSYLTDRKEVRVLQHGRTALRLRATAVPDVVRGMPTPRPPRVVFRTVARRATDDGENLVEVLGHGPVYPATQLEVHTGPDTEVDRQLRRVRFRERGAAFHTGYNGIIKIYDDRGSAKAPVMPGDEG